MQVKRIAVCLILAYLGYFAFFSNAPTLFIPVQHFGGAVFIVGAFLLFWRHKFLPLRKAEMVFAVLFSMAHLVGITFSRYDSFALLTASRLNAVYSLLLFAGFVPFFYVAVCFLADKVLALSFPEGEEGRFGGFVAPFCLFLVAWLPYFFIYFPGNLINDSVRQLSQFTGVDPFVNHHPIISTFFMGAIFRFGLIFGGGNVGLAFITIVHNLMMAAAFSLSLVYLKKWGVAYNARLVIMVFFAVFPVFGIWAQTILKDTHSAAVTLVFVLLYIDVIRGYSHKKLILCAVAAVFAALLRNEVVFVVAPSIAALAFLPAIKKRRFIFAAAGVCVFFATRLIVGGAMAITDAEPGSVREMLNIPLQQTARFMRYHEMTEHERAVISATFDNYYLLPEVYHPRISDPIKNQFAEGTDAGEYLRVWAAMGRRAPLTYLEAAIAVSFSYVVPFGPDWMLVWRESSHDAIPDMGRDDIGYIFSNYQMRIFPARVMEFAERLPIIGFFFHTGNYTWAMAFMVLLFVKLRIWQKLIYFFPAFMIILACIASPVHGFWRYYLPILFMFPVLAALTLAALGDNQDAARLPVDTKSQSLA